MSLETEEFLHYIERAMDARRAGSLVNCGMCLAAAWEWQKAMKSGHSVEHRARAMRLLAGAYEAATGDSISFAQRLEFPAPHTGPDF